jgi:hypothetical protein
MYLAVQFIELVRGAGIEKKVGSLPSTICH